VYAVRVEEFADCDGVLGVDAALVDPLLDFVEVDGDEVGGPAIIVRLNSLGAFNETKRGKGEGGEGGAY